MSELRGSLRIRVRLLPEDGEAVMWVKPRDATLGTHVEYRRLGADHDWQSGVLVAHAGHVWWIEGR